MGAALVTAGSSVPDNLKATTAPLLALAALVIAAGFLVLTLSDRKFKAHVTSKLGDVDIAVNNRPGPKLIDLVDWLVASVQTIAHNQGHELPPLPPQKKDDNR